MNKKHFLALLCFSCNQIVYSKSFSKAAETIMSLLLKKIELQFIFYKKCQTPSLSVAED